MLLIFGRGWVFKIGWKYMAEIFEPISVAICIITYKRPLGLKRLLDSLAALKFNKSGIPNWRIVIVENDPSMPSNNVVAGFKASTTVPVTYGVEAERGIPSARNRAVQLAGEVDFIAFIDDDETADPNWLDELLNTQNTFDADVVNGPVLPKFEQTAPAWVLRGGFYDRRRFKTGTKITWANTGNVMIKTSCLQDVPGPFRKNLNLSGGSDTVLFSQLYHLGAKMIWSDEACVYEYNPASRVSTRWILKRIYRQGIDTSVIEINNEASIQVVMIRLLKSISHIIVGLLILLPLSIFRGYAGLVRSLMYIYLGIGEIGGIFGISYMEYKQTHGN
jgi:succinoglycan biosynthesis protein ExoM